MKRAGIDLGLSDNDKITLLKLARDTIKAKASGKKLPKISELGDKLTPLLKEKCGAFVTLHKKGNLRGCIGYIEGFKPLAETIQEMAISAGFQDPRFPPVQLEEVDALDIEISVLTPLKLIKDVKEIEVGKHGIYIKSGFYSGLLLPQVATEYNWDRETFLSQTCRKAGLGVDAWKKKDAEIYIFSADIFGEKDFS